MVDQSRKRDKRPSQRETKRKRKKIQKKEKEKERQARTTKLSACLDGDYTKPTSKSQDKNFKNFMQTFAQRFQKNYLTFFYLVCMLCV